MDIALKTPYEIIEDLVLTIEKTRKRKKIRQKDLSTMSGVPIATYQKFIYEKNISLASLIKIMYALNMMDNLKAFIKYEEIITLEDIRDKQKKKSLPQRVRLVNEK